MSQIAPLSTDSLQQWLNYWTTVHVTAIDLGLERVLPVAHALNVLKPQAKIFTVAGTNGKGSTTSTLANILQSAGYQVGLYQSPHIIRFNERIRINGIEISDQALIDAFVQVEQARQQCELTLSFFEATTLAALLIFKQQLCDVWVLEVGLGGRLDVVNIIDPDVAVITNIGLDHVDWLGDSIEKIAFEKAGIIRSNIPVIFAGNQELPQAIADKIAECQASLFQYQKDYDFQINSENWYLAMPALTMALPHGHLAHINQSAAIMAALVSDLNITQTAIETALEHTRLAGRFEQRYYKKHHLILDVAHNPHGVAFLTQQLTRYLQLNPEITQVNAVFSMLEDKDIDGVIELLTNIVNKWYIAPLNVYRAASIERLQQALNGYNVKVSDNIQYSFQIALRESEEHQLILVCGSFHTLEAVWECLLHGDEQ
ncbi:bifunctional tetrahydrofolate synthase/dihydrofolate synthase [Acinetobacter qingfengensis]|uniref:Dihydrofolate synthase/folylpolyglutamate synthase n=1 Tax=Acinetobacter qingfengensis TaxID=1262585 RepID=A0A1E7QXG3_9GAMM|nr:bifunctional tetrahydrofolate synthase/dihydrofolate synthase [Acinetobacter qingfengensis]KAA8731640.1 bifunctional tetrahydrofolate synthase/dihydrofolate synthase [Acinetobacter qingfengensis]OEY91743.1 bifunctional folylpolyglutamate synthase/dihydrofolate synthase [Acinetobacter qingfengensis]